MQRVLFSLLMLLFAGIALGQKKPPAPTPEEVAYQLDRQSFKCLHTDKYTTQERRSFFPFATATKIRLISFEAYRLPDPQFDAKGELLPFVRNKDTVPLITPLAPNRFAINYRKAKETRTLSSEAIDRLTDILYNVGFTPIKGVDKPSGVFGACFNPRNAILFLNEKGQVTQYIEICFQCKGYYYSSAKTRPSEFCEQKYELLSSFFTEQGILYGTAQDF